MINPWNLTPHQISALEAYSESASMKRAADKLGVGKTAVCMLIRRAKQSMGVKHVLHCAIEWDRFKRGAL